MMDSDYGGAFGVADPPALTQIRSVWLASEPLVDDTGLDDAVNPTELHVHLSDGIAAPSGRFDVRWSRENYYNFHYTEPASDARFDRHPKPNAPDKHFHEPPDEEPAVQSCITVEVPPLVARAVHKCWRRAYDAGDPAKLNVLDNPP